MTLQTIIAQYIDQFMPVFRPALNSSNTIKMDLSAANLEFAGKQGVDLDKAIESKIYQSGCIAAVGGYLENRSVYAATDLFDGDSERCIHIGVDVFIGDGTEVFLPLDGQVQSCCHRNVSGDYGPVIIMEHELSGCRFYSLYGHLSEQSLVGLSPGKKFASGELIARIGGRPGNGNWSPHLHFQLIADMQGLVNDYPGVVRKVDLDFYRTNCPDPTSLLVSE
ncbi:MAG: murein DD-endopeptidase MepM/ murein hydrolase activator NlpD [Gammaproteobacteria bacterium]|jgi:murein DD-endopeptidase MepM/ murein hydrolase activator NlpD